MFYGVEVTLEVLDKINEKKSSRGTAGGLEKRPMMLHLSDTGEMVCSVTLETFLSRISPYRMDNVEKRSREKSPHHWSAYAESLDHSRSPCAAKSEFHRIPSDPQNPRSMSAGNMNIQIPRGSRRSPSRITEFCEDSDIISVPKIRSNRNPDNTYCLYTAKLTMTPSVDNHLGAEYVCQVEHPSLEKAIKRSTRGMENPGQDLSWSPSPRSWEDNMLVQFSHAPYKVLYPKDIKVKLASGGDTTQKRECSR
ncbi:unnamed protein product [Ranitomeya imitator]|uniref:Uncharacterized protein n=1 Tax=Ranitomeya imitator TaxID=111125 RepID=A0ABN9L6J3_9NEOB|nr:unnamed protein product [Ranitomeya imitator]